MIQKRAVLVSSLTLSLLTALSSCSDSGSDLEDGLPGRADDCRLVEEGFGERGTVSVLAEPVVQGLRVPWGVGFLPDGDILISERPGQVRLIRDGSLVENPVLSVSVAESGEGGLLGLALHPDFAENRLFYLYFTTPKEGRDVNRVERFRLADDGLSAVSDRVILDDIPAGTFHNGGRIKFGPDGNLYVGTGDARQPELAQDPSSPAGKILRMTPDGEVPDDNPFGDSFVFILGVRNTQGFDWLGNGTLLVADHGPTGELGRSGHDEVSIARPGENLGWPATWRCDRQQGFVTPSIVWEEALPPGGAAFYQGDDIPEWQGSLLIGSLRSTHLQRVMIATDGSLRVTGHEVYLEDEVGRIREVIAGPDGGLYITTSNCDSRGSCPPEGDQLLRIRKSP